jgi:hypothetical protein
MNAGTACQQVFSGTLSINDATPPEIDPDPGDVTIPCNAPIPAPPTLNATDNCDPTFPKPAAMTVDPYTPNPCAGYTITRRWNISDCQGNAAVEQVQTITVVPLYNNNGECICSPLPVIIGKFEGEKLPHSNRLMWRTMTEINSDYFNIQKSRDGVVFQTIGRQESKAAAGNSTTPLDYEFEDRYPYAGHNYYRLEQHDLDGAVSYSRVIDLYRESGTPFVRVYPNPAKSVVHIEIDPVLQRPAVCRLLDLTGRVVREIDIAGGSGSATMSLEGLAQGSYLVQLLRDKAVSFVDNLLIE